LHAIISGTHRLAVFLSPLMIWRQPRTLISAVCLVSFCVLAAEEELEDNPVLSVFSVTGRLPSNIYRQLIFVPKFISTDPSTHVNYHCMVDFQMEEFTVDVEAQSPAILSKVTRSGIPVPSRLKLRKIHLEPGQKTIFSVDVTDRSTRSYTLVIERRTGRSTELLALRPVTGNFTVPYHAGELQESFDATQAFYENYFEFEYVKADGGQSAVCNVEKSETIGNNVPTASELYMHPTDYIPSFEQLHNMSSKEIYDPAEGQMVKCIIPIDTWRRVTVGVHIVSADKSSQRHVRIHISRKGCPAHTFYYAGRCMDYCPTRYYRQDYNWRCGACERFCEFCSNWDKCDKCFRDTDLLKYEMLDNGQCFEHRVHNYKVYYDMARYLAVSCGVLLVCYCCGCLFWAARCCCGSPDEEEGSAREFSARSTQQKRFLGKDEPAD